MLSDAARAMIDQRERERSERIAGARPLFDTAYTKGDFALVEVGAEIFAREEGDISNIRLRADGQARGGIIVEITATGEVTDDGEIVERRAFRTIDYDPRVPLWQATTVLTEAQVDPDSFTVPDVARIRGLYRRLCREVGKLCESNHIASKGEIDMVQDAARLAAIVGARLG